MAPEVRKGIPYGSKVDMYSFGILMWELWYSKEIFTDLIKNDEEIPPSTEVKGYLSRGPEGDGGLAPRAEWTKAILLFLLQLKSDVTKINLKKTDLSQAIILYKCNPFHCLQRALRTGLLDGNICQCYLYGSFPTHS